MSDSQHPVVFPDEALPEGSVVDGEQATGDAEEAFDYVVVGSGAAGAVAAHALITSGASVAVVEEGPWVRTRDFGDGVYGAFKRMFREAGTQVVEGRSYIPLLQGRCVGGSTVMNSAIAHRTPEDVLDEWRVQHGLGDAIHARALEPHFEALERELGVHAVGDEALGGNSSLFLEEATAHGLPARRIHRYERGCRGSGRCFTGCPSAAKQGMNVSYVPWALSKGARLYASFRVERVLLRGSRAVGVAATATGARGRGASRLALHAREAVVIAASTVQTPNLLRRSGLRARAIGRDFQCHPGVAVAGVFDAPVDMFSGATQGAESVHLRRAEGIKLETLAIAPELAAVRVPGIGQALMGRFGELSHIAMWAVIVRSEARGTVDAAWRGRDRVRLSLAPRDVERARRGLSLLSRMMFEAGAREVWPGLFGVPSILRSPDEVRHVDAAPADARAYGFITTHLFGAARMGLDPRSSAVGPDFRVHGLENLFVVDSSVFPTNLGVNPQHSIMAMSRLAATRIAETRRRGGRSGPAHAAA
ncbi:MAG: GMC family oxidoreductase [Myxococcales bacterium]|nr:GMC family oxidoreductase [Myxococcales bacterium]